MTDVPYENMRPVQAAVDTRETGPLLPVPTGRDVVWTLLGGLGGMGLGGVIGAVLGYTVSGASVGALLAVVLAGVFGCGGLYLALVRRNRWSMRDLGFRRPDHSLFHLLWQIPVLVLAAAILTAAMAVPLGITPGESDDSITRQSFDLGPVSIVVVFVMVSFVVPVIEEIIFRRVLLDWLLSKLPTVPAAVLVIVLFALCHVAPPVMLYILFFGTTLVILRHWYRSLWAPLITHSVNNALVTIIAGAAVLG